MTPEEKSIENEYTTEQCSNNTLSSFNMTSPRGSSLTKQDSRLESPSPEDSPAITPSTTPRKPLSPPATSTILQDSTNQTNTFFQPPIPVSLEDALATLVNHVRQIDQLHQNIKNALVSFLQKHECLCELKNEIHNRYKKPTPIRLAINYDTTAKSGTADRVFLTINQHPVYEVSLEQSNNTAHQPKIS